MAEKKNETSTTAEKLLDSGKKATHYTMSFATPFKYEDKELNSLTFDFTKLTGRDFVAIYRELGSKGIIVLSPRFDPDFCTIMAAKACTEPAGSDLIQALPMNKFEQLMVSCRNFFNEPG